MKKVLIPLAARDFDPTESAVPWKILKDHGIEVLFATPKAQVARGDERMAFGFGLGPWKPFLQANDEGRQAYQQMILSHEFKNPLDWNSTLSLEFDALLLPGGHAPGMKEYLESKTLQNLTAQCMQKQKLVAAICHGVVLAARSCHSDGSSVLKDYRVTALLRTQELTAWALTALWLGSYYRTYPETVQSEVTRNLKSPHQFLTGPFPLSRDSMNRLTAGFIVEDRNLITARWPGDAHHFGFRLAQRLI